MVEHITSTRRSTVWALTKDQRRVPVAHPAGRAPPMTESSCSARRVVGRICSPGLFEIPHQRRVNEQAPERCNASHIEPSKQTVRLHQHGHLAAVAAGIVGDPAHVHHRVDGPVRQLGSPLIVSEIEPNGRGVCRTRSGRGIVQIGRQPAAQGGYSGADAGVRAVPSEQLPASGSRTASGRSRTGCSRYRRRLSAAPTVGSRRARPVWAAPTRHKVKVAGDFVDAPGS